MVFQIHRYLFVQHGRSVLVVVGTLLGITWLTQGLRLFNFLMNSAAPIGLTLKLLLLLLPGLLAPLLPLGIFLGLMLSFQRLQQDREWVALQALGLGRFTLIASSLFIALIACLLHALLVWQIVPQAMHSLRWQQQALANNYMSALLKTGTFTDAGDKLTIFIRQRQGNRQLEGIFIHDVRNPKEEVTITAQKGVLNADGEQPQLTIYQGVRQGYKVDEQRVSWLTFDKYNLALDWNQMYDQFTPKTTEYDARSLWKKIQNPQTTSTELLAEWLGRWSEPLTIWVMVSLVAISALLAGAPRQSRAWPRIALILSALLMQLLILSTTQLAERSPGWWMIPFGLPALSILGIAWLIWIAPYRRQRIG